MDSFQTRNRKHRRTAAKPAAIAISTKFFLLTYLLTYSGGNCNNDPLLIQAKFDMRQYTHGLHLHAKFHLNGFIVSIAGGQKPQFCSNFDIWGHLYRPPFIDEGQVWYARADPLCNLHAVTCSCVGVTTDQAHLV